MSFAALLRIALRALAVNKLRSALTMLGILIGTAAVILLVAVGTGEIDGETFRRLIDEHAWVRQLGSGLVAVISDRLWRARFAAADFAMNRLRVLFRTTAFRLSALYLLLFSLCAAFLVFYVTAMSEGLLQQQTRDAVTHAASTRLFAAARTPQPGSCRCVQL